MFSALKMTQFVTHFNQSAPEAGLDCAHWKAGFFGNLRMGQSIIEMKLEDPLRFLGKQFDCPADVLAFAIDRRGGLGRKVGKGFRFGKRLELRASVFPSCEIYGASSGKHADESALGCYGRVVALGGSPDVGECFLHNIFRRRAIAHIPLCDRPYQATVSGNAFVHGAFDPEGNLAEDPVI